MVAAESSFEVQGEIHLVSQRKYNLDPHRPWWEIAYFRLVFLPIVRFGFKWMHIAAPSAMEPDGTIVLIEQAGAYSDPAAADARCENEYFSAKPLPLDADLPLRSAQYGGHRTPKSIMPDRYRRRYFPTPVNSRQMAEVKRNLETISRAATGT